MMEWWSGRGELSQKKPVTTKVETGFATGTFPNHAGILMPNFTLALVLAYYSQESFVLSLGFFTPYY